MILPEIILTITYKGVTCQVQIEPGDTYYDCIRFATSGEEFERPLPLPANWEITTVIPGVAWHNPVGASESVLIHDLPATPTY